jgi:hypothetical protein
MKRILIIAAVLFTYYPAVFSQENPGRAKVFSIGPAVGFGHAGIRNTSGTDLFKPSVNAGVIFNYSTNQHIGFAGDVLWSSEGARIDRDGIETDITLQYVRVPLKFAYFFGTFEDNFRPKLTIGPSMGFLLDADKEVEGIGTSDVTASYKTFDIGLNGSAGFNLKLRPNVWLNTDLNYYHGLRAIRFDERNSSLGLKVGLAFGL